MELINFVLGLYNACAQDLPQTVLANANYYQHSPVLLLDTTSHLCLCGINWKIANLDLNKNRLCFGLDLDSYASLPPVRGEILSMMNLLKKFKY